MEVAIKKDASISGSTPLPQRVQKNLENNINKQLQIQSKPNDSNDEPPAEKKPRFSQGGAQNQAHRGIGGNRGFSGNRGGRGGNQGRGAGNHGFNRFPNQQENQQNKDVKDSGNYDKIKHNDTHEISRQEYNLNRVGNRGSNQDRSRGGNRGGPNSGIPNGPFSRSDDFFIGQRLRALAGPTYELSPIDTSEELKFSGRNRLYVGNLTNDVTEKELREIFKPFGEIGEIFSNAEKNFAFLKLDYHANAEKAKRELDGTVRKGRNLRVRFAPNATIVRVKNLTQFVSNELLYKSFEIFGPVERANIIVDDRGKHTGEGIVEFAKKSSANACLRLCSDKCFFLTASLRPCVVEPFEASDDPDGLPDKSLNKKSHEFLHERNIGPRFAEIDTFEHEYGTRWKQLYELYKTKQEALRRELEVEEDKLEAKMKYARYEHETELLRQELRKRESGNERKKMEWEMREKQAEELKQREDENVRRQQNQMQARMLRQEEEMRRRQQENILFMQAQQLNSLLDEQEGSQTVGKSKSKNIDGFGAGINSPFDFRGNHMGGNTNMIGGNNGPNNQQDQFEFGGSNQNQGTQGNQRGNNGGGNNNSPWERRRHF